MKAKFSPEIEEFVDGLFGADINVKALEAFMEECRRGLSASQEPRARKRQPTAFSARTTAQDHIRAHGMGIRLD